MATSRDLLDEAALILNDATGESYSYTELLKYLNEGLATLVNILPTAFAALSTLTLVAGTKQSLPAGAAALQTILRSVDPNTGNPISAVHQVDLTTLDQYTPTWHAATQATPEEWAPDPGGDPYVFWVNPPATAGSKVDAVIVSNPATLQIDTTIPTEARYNSKLVDYVVYRALSKDADYAAQDGRATIHLQRFLQGPVTNGAPQGSGQ